MAKKSPLYVVPLDNSEPSKRALDFAIFLAGQTGARLLLIHVINWSGFMPVSALEMAERPADKKKEEEYTKGKILAPALKKATDKGVDAETYFNWGNPARLIHQRAAKQGAEMIILGRRGHTQIAELVIGSVANSLAHHSKIPVVLVP